MGLTKTDKPAQVTYNFTDTVVAEAGTSFSIETSPGGEEVLIDTVPEGKKWEIDVNVHIEETDA